MDHLSRWGCSFICYRCDGRGKKLVGSWVGFTVGDYTIVWFQISPPQVIGSLPDAWTASGWGLKSGPKIWASCAGVVTKTLSVPTIPYFQLSRLISLPAHYHPGFPIWQFAPILLLRLHPKYKEPYVVCWAKLLLLAQNVSISYRLATWYFPSLALKVAELANLTQVQSPWFRRIQ